MCCTGRSNGFLIVSILILIAFSAKVCCSLALSAGSNDLPHTCESRSVFNRISRPHRGQAVIKTSACLHGGMYSLPSGVSVGVSAGVSAGVPARILLFMFSFFRRRTANELFEADPIRVPATYVPNGSNPSWPWHMLAQMHHGPGT